ncbi:MAG: hypothetical protein AAB956_04080 [Patescibacteria group bacterium]
MFKLLAQLKTKKIFSPRQKQKKEKQNRDCPMCRVSPEVINQLKQGTKPGSCHKS